MPTTMLRAVTAALVLALCGVTFTRAQARSRPDEQSSARNKENQIQDLEQRLAEPYGPHTWFVFSIATFQPDISAGLTFSRGWRHRHAHAQMHVGRRLVFRSCTVHGTQAAAQLIWHAQQSPLPLRFSYRGFEHEEQASLFRKLMSP